MERYRRKTNNCPSVYLWGLFGRRSLGTGTDRYIRFSLVFSSENGRNFPVIFSLSLPIWCCSWDILYFIYLPDRQTIETDRVTVRAWRHRRCRRRGRREVGTTTLQIYSISPRCRQPVDMYRQAKLVSVLDAVYLATAAIFVIMYAINGLDYSRLAFKCKRERHHGLSLCLEKRPTCVYFEM